MMVQRDPEMIKEIGRFVDHRFFVPILRADHKLARLFPHLLQDPIDSPLEKGGGV